MKYLVQPVVAQAANAPDVLAPADHGVFTIASDRSGLLLTVRDCAAWQSAGPLKQVSVGNDGEVWGVNAAGQACRGVNGAWVVQGAGITGRVAQVAVGSVARVYCVTEADAIYRWRGSAWQIVPGTLCGISAAADGSVWGVNRQTQIFRMARGVWEIVGGNLNQVSVGCIDDVWGIALNGHPVRWGRGGWEEVPLGVPGTLRQVSVAADGTVWGVTPSNAAYRFTGPGWKPIELGCKQLSVGSANRLWAIDKLDNAMRAIPAGGGAGAEVIQCWWDESPHQQWIFEPGGGGFLRIRNVATGLALSTGSSAAIECAVVANDPRQQWSLRAHGRGYRLDNRARAASLDMGKHDAGAAAGFCNPSQVDAFQLHFAQIRPPGALFDPRVTLFDHAGYTGTSLAVGMGSHSVGALGPPAGIRSHQIPAGVRVTAFGGAGCTGETDILAGNVPDVRPAFDIRSIRVEKVVTLYEGTNYSGPSSQLTTGRYSSGRSTWGNMPPLGIANNSLSSLRVPQGMMVIVYGLEDFKGGRRVYFQDCPDLGEKWKGRVTSVVVKHLGIPVVRDMVRFGGRITLKGAHGKYITAEDSGTLTASRIGYEPRVVFEVLRAGPTRHSSHLCYGDTIALRSTVSGKFVTAESSGDATCNRVAANQWERWIVVPSGRHTSGTFVSKGDVISLRSWQSKHLVAEPNNDANANRDVIGPWEQFTLMFVEAPRIPLTPPPETAPDAQGLCGAEAPYSDVCPGAACSAAFTVVEACGAAETGIALCGADVLGVSIDSVAGLGIDDDQPFACGEATVGGGEVEEQEEEERAEIEEEEDEAFDEDSQEERDEQEREMED